MVASAETKAPAKEGRRERRSRELRERIYQTAQQLFLERGFDETTISQIAEAADIAPATFFNHFQNKAAVLQDMTAEVFEHLQALVDEQLAHPASTQKRIVDFADRIAEEILRVRTLAHDALLGLLQVGVRTGEASPHLRGVHAPFAEMLREGQTQGQVRSDLDSQFLAEVVIGALNSAVTNWLSDPEYPLADRLHRTAILMGEAIAPAAGRVDPERPRTGAKQET